MSKFTAEERKALLSVPIEDILARLGKSTEHNRSGLYYSPFRDEDNMSFHIDSNKNIWYDFGTSEGGGLVDFVCKYAGCERTQVLDWLADLMGVIPTELPQRPVKNIPKESTVTIEQVGDEFTMLALVYYASDRGINKSVLMKYCKEVFYSLRSYPGKQFYAIGFPNNGGGYTLRSSRIKICTLSDITTIGKDGNLTTEKTSDKVVVFEGFMDFLSWVVINGGNNNGFDCCILNSVSNIRKALPWLSEHSRIEVYFDNDAAGKNSLMAINNELADITSDVCVCDMSSMYESYNDLNEMLMAQKEGQQCSHTNTKHHGTNNFKRGPGKTGQDQLG